MLSARFKTFSQFLREFGVAAADLDGLLPHRQNGVGLPSVLVRSGESDDLESLDLVCCPVNGLAFLRSE